MTENPRGHFILRRFRDARSTGTVHGAECSCGDMITGASPQTRDNLVTAHLARATELRAVTS